MARKESSGIIWFSDVFDRIQENIYREEAYLPDRESRIIYASIKHIYKTFFPVAEANDWRFLKTAAGSVDQPVRRDFPPTTDTSALANPCSVPGSIMIVLQDDTYPHGRLRRSTSGTACCIGTVVATRNQARVRRGSNAKKGETSPRVQQDTGAEQDSAAEQDSGVVALVVYGQDSAVEQDTAVGLRGVAKQDSVTDQDSIAEQDRELKEAAQQLAAAKFFVSDDCVSTPVRAWRLVNDRQLWTYPDKCEATRRDLPSSSQGYR
ncbi:hypothetical protein ON010_g8946 [Phytophthora cinnamomi]|nr:hypothetical protein ON010_g8946 [Phytophthora cinnamomi]